MNELTEKAKHIKCLICDVDGVLTDGLLHIDNLGNELKSFHVQDGMGLKLLMAADIVVAVITTSQNAVIDHRMKQLGILHYFTGQVDKRDAFEQLKLRLGLSNKEIAYIGDDLPDLAIIQQVGLGVAVANAVPQVKEFAVWQTEQQGGRGAVREVCELILNAQDKQEQALTRYLAS
ncbi:MULTISPECIES: KdsC family phosphatase [Legionella]|uniref:3-deoxy-D-manno-octulosonate 8-phosphate phosphatase KdsC n=1 Tax=Legionella donaldsonii TaxID=45060 RepID=A0A378J6K4_9GAMM|nr:MULTISPECIES: HAD hydrolase family protein [Legionella]MCC5015687.1 HAD hydrolase family protein [Legionella sp. 31fI33]STX43016.1 hydrolase [Legionella donaldsonii]